MEPLHSTLEQQQQQNSVAAFQHSSLVAVVGHLLQLRNLHQASVRVREPRMVVVGCRVGGKLWLMVATLVPEQQVHPLEEHVHRLNKGTKLTLQWEHCCCCRIDAAFHLDMLQFLLKFQWIYAIKMICQERTYQENSENTDKLNCDCGFDHFDFLALKINTLELDYGRFECNFRSHLEQIFSMVSKLISGNVMKCVFYILRIKSQKQLRRVNACNKKFKCVWTLKIDLWETFPEKRSAALVIKKSIMKSTASKLYLGLMETVGNGSKLRSTGRILVGF